MQLSLIFFPVLFLGACSTIQTRPSTVSILLDLDPGSADRTVIVESITADKQGRLYLPDRVTGNILRVDPKAPKPVVVGRIEPREIKGKKVNADPSGAAFNQQGDLFIAVGPFSEVVRIRGTDLNPQKPGSAQTFATGTTGANGIAFDRSENLFISGGGSGIVYRVSPNGGSAEAAVQIEKHALTLPDGKGQQATVANGLEFDRNDVLHVADTARGAIWKVVIGSDGKGGKPTLLAQSPLLEGADGLAFDSRGNLWVVANERNALIAVTPSGEVREHTKNASQGPLEFPAGIVFVGSTAYIANYDTPRRDNMDPNGKTALDGIGASIAQLTP
ncbi:MAG TPA: SMP-30/gluconolactonase/LRE family protein [Candidatus Polarisedimenticolaceae bacterium]|nr:SMP-30/gluconolactonase/LRE family protein [Candidatus Polarisedimenticolaceae bacterium]